MTEGAEYISDSSDVPEVLTSCFHFVRINHLNGSLSTSLMTIYMDHFITIAVGRTIEEIGTNRDQWSNNHCQSQII